MIWCAKIWRSIGCIKRAGVKNWSHGSCTFTMLPIYAGHLRSGPEVYQATAKPILFRSEKTFPYKWQIPLSGLLSKVIVEIPANLNVIAGRDRPVHQTYQSSEKRSL